MQDYNLWGLPTVNCYHFKTEKIANSLYNLKTIWIKETSWCIFDGG